MPRFSSPKLILLLFIILILDICIVPSISVALLRPVCFYLFIVYAAIQWRGESLIRFSVGIGFVRDLLSAQPLGVETAALAACAFVLKLSLQKIERQWLLVRMMVCFLYVFSASFLTLVFAQTLGSGNLISWHSVLLIWNASAASTLFMPVFFYAMHKWFGDKVPIPQYSSRQYELFGN